MRRALDFSVINAAALPALPALCARWLPACAASTCARSDSHERARTRRDRLRDRRQPRASAGYGPLIVLTLRAWARARLWQAGDLDLHEAVDTLQAAAVRDGLVAKLGQDAVQAIMAHSFSKVRETGGDQ